mmetsp:Transcript_3672/g.5578  ORF Transcript_3672/g.5578 Transcript_3672/m.5578 type:complete len:708 (-) Transcript_3672:1953-4076(-)|eukprot:CAMPEP_0201721486 /NCGR_PEP_ID=MMETSP0593-20130828/6150_1 /ASSEMBLY_ACC=CAM_ASM_000672 /TAXON_ID=267983 /ORGANISM="Skeletonema japonicum, Strain CCMP2506" /LENGTH=707 /DNA_ID=CAMNT_0048212311 /DNA_START=45 /DNA_END=2168 /DNA_ORIENTATION=-
MQPQSLAATKRCDPEYIAVILAASQGARLYPLTSEYPDGVPKHLLPLSPLNPSCGDENDCSSTSGAATLLQRLLLKTYDSGFEMAVIAIHKDDTQTVPFLLGTTSANNEKSSGKGGLCTIASNDPIFNIDKSSNFGADVITDLNFCGVASSPSSSNEKKVSDKYQSPTKRNMSVRVVRLSGECHGSADALRYLSTNMIDKDGDNNSDVNACKGCIIPRTSHAVVMPGDLILEEGLISGSTSDGKNDVLSLLVESHRRWNAGGVETSTSAACTMLLSDVGAEDKEGIPLKESSKAKMGLQSREEEDMEYIGLTSEVPPPLSASLASLSFPKSLSLNGDDNSSPSRRVILKRSKLEVEEDEGTGSTPKLSIMKRHLHKAGGRKNNVSSALARITSGLSMSATASRDHSPSLSLRTDLHDVHLYVISNWVFQLMHARPSMASFQKEILPLLVSRQFRGVEAAFGPTAWKDEGNRDRLRKVLKDLDGVNEDGFSSFGNGHNKISTLLGMYASGKASGGLGNFTPVDADEDEMDKADATTETTTSLLTPPSFPTSVHPFVVSAQVLSREISTLTLRACTIPCLLHGCGKITSSTLKMDSKMSAALVPKGVQLSTKFNSILLPGCTLGEKVQTKSCTIGKGVSLGDRSKLNNVVVMDGAQIGANVVMQNSVVGVGAKVGDNCNLKDCVIGPGAVVATGTKTTEKGETFEAEMN